MAPVRNTLVALVGAARGAVSLAAVVVVMAGMAWLLAARDSSDGAGSTASHPPVLAAASSAPASVASDPSLSPYLEPSVEPSAEPSPNRTEPAGQTAAPTATTTAPPTPRPSPRPTPTPTPVKATPKPTPVPTHDPAPEPTPRIWAVSGSFGQTLSVNGVTARLSLREPSQDPLIQCGSREVASYDLRITWADPADAIEPWIAVGEHPFNVLWFSPQGSFASGADYVFSTCKLSGDSSKAVIEIAPEDAPVRMQRFSFH